MSEIIVTFSDDPAAVILRPVRVVLAMRTLGWTTYELAVRSGVCVDDVRDFAGGQGLGGMGPLQLADLRAALLERVYLPIGSSVRGLVLKPDVLLRPGRRGSIIHGEAP